MRQRLDLTRRAAMAGLAGASVGLAGGRAMAAATVGAAADDWAVYKARFVQPDGRVIDTGNKGQSHSEGQGMTMLFAAHFGDRATFLAVYGWANKVLRRPTDALFAWRCLPGPGHVVDDLNNATDGDLYIAWALLVGGRLWREPALTAAGRAIAADVLRLCMRRVGRWRILLPGLHGFERYDYTIINPSYYLFPAMPILAGAVPDPRWMILAVDALRILRLAKFGRWGLVADWVALSPAQDRITPAPGWPARFSFDAVRVPLFLNWAGMPRESAARSAAAFWATPQFPYQPAWTDLRTNDLSSYQAPVGMRAIANLAEFGSSGGRVRPVFYTVAQADDYYSAALLLLARMALEKQETGVG